MNLQNSIAWNKIEDRLPRHNQRVLIIINDNSDFLRSNPDEKIIFAWFDEWRGTFSRHIITSGFLGINDVLLWLDVESIMSTTGGMK